MEIYEGGKSRCHTVPGKAIPFLTWKTAIPEGCHLVSHRLSNMGFSSSTLAFWGKILYHHFMRLLQHVLVTLPLKYWYLLVVLVFIGSILAHRASAQTMSNDNYILQLDDVNSAHPKPTIKNNTLGVSDQQASEQKPELNYKIQAGFLHEKSKTPFTFSISQTLIDFSTLSPTNPILRSNKLTVSNGSANGYSVIVFEDRELSAAVASDATSPSSGFIPDTTCDNGLCSEARSALWTNPLTYGFGYRCDNIVGSDCASGFSEVEFYKQFANNSKSEMPQKVAMGTSAGKEKTVRITYKINIPGTQPFALYSNTITYIAVPNF